MTAPTINEVPHIRVIFQPPFSRADTLVYCERREEEAKSASLGVTLATVQKHGPPTRVITWDSAFFFWLPVYIYPYPALSSLHTFHIYPQEGLILTMDAPSPRQLLQQYQGLSTHCAPSDTTPYHQNYFEATCQPNSYQPGTHGFDLTASSLLLPIRQPYDIIHQPLFHTATYPNYTSDMSAPVPLVTDAINPLTSQYCEVGESGPVSAENNKKKKPITPYVCPW
jgi:hypothetical protein